MIPREATAGRTRRIRPALLVVVAVLLAAVVVWFVTHPNPARLFERGVSIGRRDSDAGEVLLRRAIAAAGGTYPDAEIGLCLVLARRGDWGAASSQFKSLDKEACRSDLLLAFGREALQANRRSEGLAALEAVGRRDVRDSVQALDLLLADYHSWGQQDALIAAARKLTELEPENPLRWELLVALLKAAYRDTDCLEAIRQALEHDLPAEIQNEFRHRLVQQLIVQGDSAAAWKVLPILQESDAAPSRIRTYEVDLYRLDGQLEKALEAITAAFPAIKELPGAYYARGVIYLDLDRFEDAARDLERAVAGNPFDARIHFKLAETYRSLRREGPAGQHRERASAITETRTRINELLKEQQSNNANPQTFERLAELYGELGEDETAGEWRQRAAAIRRQN